MSALKGRRLKVSWVTWARWVSLTLLAMLVLACAKKVPPPTLGVPPEGALGLASWYGQPYHGRPTASGEIYDMYRMTAAHRTLPFGSQVRVTNLDNGRKAEVRINDRGPFIPDRLIDLSYAAARKLGMIIAGVVPVRLELLRLAPPVPSDKFTIQVGLFANRENALRLKEKLDLTFSPVLVEPEEGPGGLLYHVWVGQFASEGEATRAARDLISQGLPAMITRLEGR